MATVATNGGRSRGSREERRRRIIERGSDRLALITGRIQSLPPEPDQSRSSTSSSGQIPPDYTRQESATFNSSLPNQESRREHEQHDVFDERVDPLQRNGDKDRSIMSGSVALRDAKEELSQISSSMKSPARDHQQEQSHHNSLTAGQIYSAMAASENIRVFCSVAAAILVILSYAGFPIPGLHRIRGIIMFRPLYLLLLTNISIVLGRVILGTQGAESRTGRRTSVPTVGGNALVDQLGKALESWLVLQRILAALFVDFSIYAVVLVSGLSLV